MLTEAETIANEQGRRILQCTIREGNMPSRKLFEGAGFHLTSAFFHPLSGNNVEVLQKVLSSLAVRVQNSGLDRLELGM